MDDVKALTAEWGEACYHAHENHTIDPHDHIARLVHLGDAMVKALAAPRPQPDEIAAIAVPPVAPGGETLAIGSHEWRLRQLSQLRRDAEGEPMYSRRHNPEHVALTEAIEAGAVALMRELEERAWLIETHRNSTLHYWTGRIIDGKDAGQWSTDVEKARRFARREDAECMITWHLNGQGRAVEHLWVAPRPQPDDVKALTLTAIFRDDSAVAAGASEHSTFRTVRFALTPDQCAALRTRGQWEMIAQVIVEEVP